MGIQVPSLIEERENVLQRVVGESQAAWELRTHHAQDVLEAPRREPQQTRGGAGGIKDSS